MCSLIHSFVLILLVSTVYRTLLDTANIVVKKTDTVHSES